MPIENHMNAATRRPTIKMSPWFYPLSHHHRFTGGGHRDNDICVFDSLLNKSTSYTVLTTLIFVNKLYSSFRLVIPYTNLKSQDKTSGTNEDNLAFIYLFSLGFLGHRINSPKLVSFFMDIVKFYILNL